MKTQMTNRAVYSAGIAFNAAMGFARHNSSEMNGNFQPQASGTV